MMHFFLKNIFTCWKFAFLLYWKNDVYKTMKDEFFTPGDEVTTVISRLLLNQQQLSMCLFSILNGNQQDDGFKKTKRQKADISLVIMSSGFLVLLFSSPPTVQVAFSSNTDSVHKVAL